MLLTKQRTKLQVLINNFWYDQNENNTATGRGNNNKKKKNEQQNPKEIETMGIVHIFSTDAYVCAVDVLLQLLLN